MFLRIAFKILYITGFLIQIIIIKIVLFVAVYFRPIFLKAKTKLNVQTFQ